MASKEELMLFARHIMTLSRMKAGDAITLNFFGGVRIGIVYRREGFYFGDEYVGNIYGAIQAYAELCASEEKE